MKILGNTMNSANLKGKTIAIALILLLAISSAATAVSAQTQRTINNGYVISNPSNSQIPAGIPSVPSYPGLTVAPDPVGVGQQVQIIIYVNPLPPTSGVEATTVVTGGWDGYTLKVTSPDGTSEDFGPYQSDPSGFKQISYTPTATGTYTLKFDFPGELVYNVTWGGMSGMPPTRYSAYFQPSTETQTFTVQQDPVPGYNEAPIPSQAQSFTMPVDGQNRYWSSLLGPWLQSNYNATGKFNPYTTAPNSAHILWTKQLNPAGGGVIGGDFQGLEYQRATGFSTPIIMNGYIFFNGPANAVNGSQFYCMSLSTGQIVWSAPGSITNGQILNWRSLQSKVQIPYLWSVSGTAWNLYDANTGRLLVSFTGAPTYTQPTGTTTPTVILTPPDFAIGADIGGAAGGGTLLAFLSGLNSYKNETLLQCWNATQAIVNNSNNPVVWTMPAAGSTVAWTKGLQYNVTLPHIFTQYVGQGAVNGPFGPQSFSGNTMVMTPTNYIQGQTTNKSFEPCMGVDINTGNLKWYTEIPLNQYQEAGTTGGFATANDGVFTFFNADVGKLLGYSSDTGSKLWESKITLNDFGNLQSYSGTNAYGNIYVSGYDGYLHCINQQTGNATWTTIGQLGGQEMPQPAYPFSGATTVADGKVYATTGKAYETEPLYRGHKLYCFDAYSGQQLWNISGQQTVQAIVDGYMLATNAYDGLLYCYGKGQTATTVIAPMTSITAGAKVVIQGTVTDQSLGVMGSAAIADKDMTAWMEYKYMDQPYPSSATGVPVSIDAVDPNGNFVHLGDTHSDNAGAYSYVWTPPAIAGQYNIIATFGGSQSYYSSSGETSAVVVDASATVAPLAAPTSVADMYFVPAIAGLFVLVIVVLALVVLLMLRKRP